MFLETRPVYVRKEKRTKGHVFVVKLAYIIAHELKRVWKDLEVTIEEGINELLVVTSEEIKIGKISYQQIPERQRIGDKTFEGCRGVITKGFTL